MRVGTPPRRKCSAVLKKQYLQYRKKNFSKKFEKPLDKPHGMWYNKSVKRGKEPNLVVITQ